ncbi:MAG: tetratricopeptide repeat protein [Planctomycetota bacterium]|nr:tetratricopeptide repeat protein [Planctomycetota bacterium]
MSDVGLSVDGRNGRRLARAALLVAVALGCVLTGCKGGATRARERSTERSQTSDAYASQARDLRTEGREDEALALLSRAIELNPTLTVAHLEMADIYEERGDYDLAERSYATAAGQEPANFSAQFGHGRVLHLLNRISEAVRAYLRALAIRPDDYDANLALATAYIQIDGPSQALPYALRATQLNPASGPAHANLGSVYSALGRHREAVEEYRAAAELMDLTPNLLLNLADSLGKLQRYEEMINTLDTANRLEPTAAAHERTGFAYFKLRRYEEAKSAFAQAIAQDATYFPALNGLGVCRLNEYLLSNKSDVAAHDSAMQYFRQSLRINGRQPRIVDLLARYER